MAKGSPIGAVLLLLAGGWLTGCGSPSPSMPSPGPAVGTIELTTSSPDGSSLVVTQCLEEGDLFPCTRDLHMTFSVVLNRGVDRALVQPQFFTDSGRLCGATQTAMVSLTAGTPATLTASSVYLVLQGSSTSPECLVPLQTTRLVAHLYQVNSSGEVAELLTQEFAKAYNFINP